MTLTVLLLDDDPAEEDILRRGLDQSGRRYELRCAHRIEDATELLHRWEPDIIFVDRLFDGIGRFAEAVQRIRRLGWAGEVVYYSMLQPDMAELDALNVRWDLVKSPEPGFGVAALIGKMSQSGALPVA